MYSESSILAICVLIVSMLVEIGWKASHNKWSKMKIMEDGELLHYLYLRWCHDDDDYDYGIKYSRSSSTPFLCSQSEKL